MNKVNGDTSIRDGRGISKAASTRPSHEPYCLRQSFEWYLPQLLTFSSAAQTARWSPAVGWQEETPPVATTEPGGLTRHACSLIWPKGDLKW